MIRAGNAEPRYLNKRAIVCKRRFFSTLAHQYAPRYNPAMATVDRIAAWMRQQLTSAGARGFVVGLSGGLDSAVVARLAQLAAPTRVIGAILPCYSDPED